MSREPIRERGMQPALCRPEPPTPVSVLPSTPPPGPHLPHVYGLLEQTAEKLGAAKARISTLEALTDQLAELVDALRDTTGECDFDHHGYCQAHMWFAVDKRCPHPRATAALRAYEADKEARNG